MRSTHRRHRNPDPLATTAAIREVLSALKSALPKEIPNNERDAVALLNAARHIQRYQATETRRGRKSKFDRRLLLRVQSRLSDILERETSSRIGFSSFVDHYLRLLDFPADVQDALSDSTITLFEASQLARLTPERLRTTDGKARDIRQSLLATHQSTGQTSSQLRLRVNELLKSPTANQVEDDTPSGSDSLEDFDPYDPTHLFWDQIRQLGFALREIRPEDVLEDELEQLLKASEPVLNILSKIRHRKERKTLKLQL